VDDDDDDAIWTLKGLVRWHSTWRRGRENSNSLQRRGHYCDNGTIKPLQNTLEMAGRAEESHLGAPSSPSFQPPTTF